MVLLQGGLVDISKAAYYNKPANLSSQGSAVNNRPGPSAAKAKRRSTLSDKSREGLGGQLY